MSWKKQSAEAGLAGLSPREAALVALSDETMVMKMPDPLVISQIYLESRRRTYSWW